MEQRTCKNCGAEIVRQSKLGRPPAYCGVCRSQALPVEPVGDAPACSSRNCPRTCVWHPLRAKWLIYCEEHRQAHNAYSQRHYEANRSERLLATKRRKRAEILPKCLVEACKTPKARGDGYCATHHKILLRDGHPGNQSLAKEVKNGITDAGYRLVHDPVSQKRRLEHRVVMEQQLGRYLWPFENVHHKNGVRHDNRLDNLELWTKPQVPGQRPEDLAAWVVEHYPEIVRQALTDVTT